MTETMPLAERYLDLLKSALLNELYVELEAQLLMSVLCAAKGIVLDLPQFQAVRQDEVLIRELLAAKRAGDTILLESGGQGPAFHVDGNLRNFTEFGYTMVGRKRLDHLQACVEDVLAHEVPGDFLEAGVWRGGCCILMRAVLEARGSRDRAVWLADSFEGMPASRLPQDRGFDMDAARLPILAVTMEEVERNFRRFGLLDERVKFLPGWFEQTLPRSSTGPLSLLRVDCDLYASTRTVLESLCGRVSSGGWIIIDDYGILPPCRQAVDEFRASRSIAAPLETIDEHAVCWRVA